MNKVPRLHIVVVIWGFLEILLFCGVIFGWHSVVYVYKEEGYFAGLCPKGNNSSHPTVPPATNFSFSGSDISFNATNNEAYSSRPELSCDERLKQASHSHQRACDPQDQRFNLIFSLATMITGFLCIFNGVLYDRLGTRACRCLSIICFIIAFSCLTTASPDTPNMLFPGFILLTYGGYLILVTNMQLAGLVPRFRSTLITMCSGSYDSSAAVFLLIKLAHGGGLKINYSFVIQGILASIIVVSTIFIHRKSRFPWPLPPNYKFRFTVCDYLDKKEKKTVEKFEETAMWNSNETGSMVLRATVNRKLSFTVSENQISKEPNLMNGSSVTEKTPVPSVWKVLKSPLFLWNLHWLCFQRLRSWFFVGNFNPWITRLACGDHEVVSQYTSFFAAVQFIGFFTSPMSGRLMDRKVKVTYKDQHHARLHASIASFVLCSGVQLLYTILAAIPVIQIQYATFLLHSVGRSFIYGPNFAFAANAYPMEHFGKVTGVILTASALFGMLQYPLFLLIQGPLQGNSLVVDILFVAMLLLSFGHPAYIWNLLRKERLRQRKDPREKEKSLLEDNTSS